MKEYKLNVTKTGTVSLDGEWGVVFTTEIATSGKEITFCAIRHGISNPPYSGCSVKHPKDTPNEYRGMHDAFKRAVEAMLSKEFDEHTWTFVGDKFYSPDIERKHIESRFRGALWKKLGQPGYKKNENENRVQLALEGV